MQTDQWLIVIITSRTHTSLLISSFFCGSSSIERLINRTYKTFYAQKKKRNLRRRLVVSLLLSLLSVAGFLFRLDLLSAYKFVNEKLKFFQNGEFFPRVSFLVFFPPQNQFSLFLFKLPQSIRRLKIVLKVVEHRSNDRYPRIPWCNLCQQRHLSIHRRPDANFYWVLFSEVKAFYYLFATESRDLLCRQIVCVETEAFTSSKYFVTL